MLTKSPGTRFRIAEYVLEQLKRPFAIEEFRLDDSEPKEPLPDNRSNVSSAPSLVEEEWDNGHADTAPAQ